MPKAKTKSFITELPLKVDSAQNKELVIRRELNGKKRWFVQLINEGLPYSKTRNQVGCGVVGIDLNISNIAFVAD